MFTSAIRRLFKRAGRPPTYRQRPSRRQGLCGSLNNLGLINQTGGTLLVAGGDTLNNEAGGVFQLASDTGIGSYYGSGTFNNQGILEMIAGTGTSYLGSGTSTYVLTLSNTGTVKVSTGTLEIASTVSQVSGGTLSGGSWEVFASSTVPATLEMNSEPYLTIIAKGTPVELSGPNSSFSNLSALNTIAGKLEVVSGASFSTAGDLTVTGSGLVDLGAGSVLTVNGNFDLTSKATLQIGLGGTSKAPTIGQLQATGTVTLAGKLKLTTSSKPAVGSTFEILNNEGSAAISGIFAGLPEGATFVVNGMTFRISYVGGTGNDVTLTRVA
jgi:hypothetical protein